MNTYAVTCPACHSSFKLTHDLLRVASGWCECGQCQHVFDAQARLQLLPPDHTLMFLPKNASPNSSGVPRLSAAFTILKPNTKVTQSSKTSNDLEELKNTALGNVHIHTTNVAPMVTLPETATLLPPPTEQAVANTEDLSSKNHHRTRRHQWIGALFVLCLLIGIAAASRTISLYWPESRGFFEYLHLPVTTPPQP